MNTNFNNPLELTKNLNLSFLPVVQGQNTPIFQIQTIPIWNNINNFYIPINTNSSPTPQNPIIKE